VQELIERALTDHSRPAEQLWTVGEAGRRFQDGCERDLVMF
jgi:hypothetical protein